MRFRSVASLVLVALVAGAIAAHADSSGAPRRAPAPARTPTRVVAAPAATRPFVMRAPLPLACAAPVPVAPGGRTQPPQPPKAATAAPPSQQLLDAFAILRRPRADQDALSPEALEALRVRGLSPVSLDSSRLLRSTPSGGKAWVVPVPNVVGRFGALCGPVGKSAAREGVVVVAMGDAASGGGGALNDLVRGRAPVTVAACAGADHSMLSISGLVPNGVPAVFLTAPDGTAVRADVKDNGYEFLLPNQRSYEQRYVVWTGGDGTPHVQPIVTFAAGRASACKSSAKLTQSVARVSPDGAFPCTGAPIADKFPVPVPRGASRALRLRRQVAAMVYVTRCAGLGPFAPGVLVTGRPGPVPPVAVLPARPPASAVPARPVAPSAAPAPRRKHR
ncbi:MAG TPA: hypothetical protein VF080_19255 [Solirubrobacteraceae bacterium]